MLVPRRELTQIYLQVDLDLQVGLLRRTVHRVYNDFCCIVF